jgi:hypothetical protein
MDDDADSVAEIRRKLAEHGEHGDEYTDEELRFALRLVLAAAIDHGGEDRPADPWCSSRLPAVRAGRRRARRRALKAPLPCMECHEEGLPQED